MTIHTDGAEHGPTLRIPHDVADIAALEALEERLDLLDALAVLADYRAHRGVEWADLKSDLGI